jgi:hypothetical protein
MMDVIKRAANAIPFQVLLGYQVCPNSQATRADLLPTYRTPGCRGPDQSVVGAIEHPTLVRSVLLDREKHATSVNTVSVTPIQLVVSPTQSGEMDLHAFPCRILAPPSTRWRPRPIDTLTHLES